MLKQSLLKLLPILLLSFAQNAGMMKMGRCELAPTKFMAQQQSNESAEIDRLIKQLQSESNRERSKAALSLGKMGSAAQSAISELFTLLDSNPSYLRVNASLAIRQIVESTQAEIPQLLPLLKHPNPDVRADAVAAMLQNR
jgi:HEAT repeat protein